MIASGEVFMEMHYVKELTYFLDNNGKLSNSFGPFGKLYSMTTENIYGFLNNFDLKDKNVLTISGSGDQRLNAYLLGAKSVTTFDINQLTELYANLKDAAIKNLDFDEFLNFFRIISKTKNQLFFNKDLYNKLATDLNTDTNEFFGFIVDNLDHINTSNIFFYFENKLSMMKNMDGFLNKDNYKLLKDIIQDKEINFINTDISFLKKKLNDTKYDLILLSNISDYINRMFDEPLEEYRKVIDCLIDNLNPGGIIQVGYIYYSKHRYISDFTIDRKRKLYFPTNQFHTIQVKAYDLPTQKDRVIIYQK